MNTAIRDRIVADYERRTAASAAFAGRAAGVLPGGNTRTTVFHPPYPLTFAHGEGALLWDLDGNRYIDLFNNGLSLIHGHAYPPIRAAIERALPDGSALGSISPELVAYAELLIGRIGPVERLRFTNTGSEAGMLAARLARAATGRPLLLKAEFAYHGSYPDLEAGLYGIGDMPGRTLTARFNDIASFERVIRTHGPDIAGIVIEPVLFTGRVVPPEPGFLLALQDLARRNGSLLVLDDCLMLRLAPGGSCERFGIEPDLVMLGKFIGGGLPMGAVGGRADLVDHFDPYRPGSLFHGGSFNGNRTAAAAGTVALRDLDATSIDAMDRRMATLRDRLQGKADRLGLDIAVTGIGSVAGIAFLSDRHRHEDDPTAMESGALFLLAALNEGVVIAPGGLLALSTAIDEAMLAQVCDSLERALDRVAG